ncbi:hypothetical protein CPB86DRAFT_782280 [Serendipita vermifera]|nr:hypothetical protein CPB86DRAFT_782280 [Serendipita vermifera]
MSTVTPAGPNDPPDLDESRPQHLPVPAVSPPLSHRERARSTWILFHRAWWTTLKRAIKNGTGYASKPPEWSNSMLNVSDDETSASDDADAILDNDDLTWLSGQNGEENLALILVERDHSAASQASPHPTASQEALANPTVAHKPDIFNDHTYRLKGYEPSFQETNFSALTPFSWIWYRAIPWLRKGFLRNCYPQFSEPHVERAYADRVYESQKFLAFVCSVWLVINWVLALSLLSRQPQLPDIIFFYGISPALTVPLPFMVFYDIPKRFRQFYQCYLLLSIWGWSAYVITFMHHCGYYYSGGNGILSCAGRDFMNLFYYLIALPVIALFGLGQERIYATIAPIIVIIAPAALFSSKKPSWVRFALEHLFLQALCLYIHWRREILERSVYFTNKKIKDTLLALNHTRAHQSRVEAARGRSTSYIFHEVRQPLNAAFLAYQNLVALTPIQPEHRLEWDTLRIQLTMMSKLLNDVLDQKRMDAGRFEIVSRPYAFHQVVRQALSSCQMATDRKEQKLLVNLDKNIDISARVGMYRAQHKSEEEITKLLEANTSEDGTVVGDETRLSQILNNLLNNSSKFTPARGTITINTRLLSNNPPRPSTASSKGRFKSTSLPLLTPEGHHTTSSSTAGGGKWEEDIDKLIIRIEVVDNGSGISPTDVKERKLFSPYAQAGLGRLQGGSGTGLGLSLVRRIVKLMGGRMGVESLPTVGTTFWVELPLKIATTPANATEKILPPPLVSSPMSSYTSNATTQNASTLASSAAPLSEAPASSSLPSATTSSDTPKQREHSVSLQSSVGKGLIALVVEDDKVLRTLLQRLLLRLGCEVECAEDGQVALEVLGLSPTSSGAQPKSSLPAPSEPSDTAVKDPPRIASPGRTHFNVIFLDNQMPRVTGTQVATALRRANRDEYIVGTSGDASIMDQESFRAAGADEVLPKPILEQSVRAVLQKVKHRQAIQGSPDSRISRPP